MRDVVQINTKRGAFSVGIQAGRGIVDLQGRATPTLPAEFADVTIVRSAGFSIPTLDEAVQSLSR